MANQENSKTTDHLNNANMRICQAQAVLKSLTQNAQAEGGDVWFGEGMGFTEVTNALWAIDDLLSQAKDFCHEGFKASCADQRGLKAA